MKRTIALAALAGVAGAGAYVWLGAAPTHQLDAGDARLVAAGAAVYATHCAVCHGVDLEGQPDWRQRRDDGRLPAPPHDASGHTWHHSDEVLFRIVKDGIAWVAPAGYESDMPAYRDVLDDADIRAVLSYIRSTWPPEIQARQAMLNRRR